MAAPHALDLRPAAALRPPRRLPALADCLVLAALLHLLAVAVFGSAPGGTAQLGQSVWGAINVRLAGTGPAGPETAPPPEVVTGPPGTAATQRWGGAVRDSSAPTPAAQPGAARLGTWNPARTAAKADTLPPAASPGPAAAIPAPAPAPVPALVQDPAPAPPAEPGPPPALGALRATAQPLQPLAPLPAVAAPVPATATPAPPAVPALAPLPAPATRALAPMPTAVPATAAPLLQVPQPLATARPLAAPPQAPVLRELPAAAPTTALPTAPTTAPPDTTPPAPAPDPVATPAPAAPQAVPLAPSPTGVPMTQPVPAAGTTRQGLPQRPAFGAPDAGAAVGTDVATPPAAAASQPRLNLDYVRPRGGEISTLGRRGVVNALPVPPDVKDKLAEDIAKSAREDCRKAYAGGGLAAVVPLAVDALRKDGCRW